MNENQPQEPRHMTPAWRVITHRTCGDAETRLWQAADDVLEYRLEIETKTGDDRHDLQHVINFLQQAAVAVRRGPIVLVLEALQSARWAAWRDEDVKFDIYRLMVNLGYDCPAHGERVFDYPAYRSGKCCAVCGYELQGVSLVVMGELQTQNTFYR